PSPHLHPSPLSSDIPTLSSLPTRRSSDLRQDYDIHLGVSQEPEQMLIQYRGTALIMQYLALDKDIRQEERSTKASIHDQKQCCGDRKSTRLNSSHVKISYAVFCLKKKTTD